MIKNEDYFKDGPGIKLDKNGASVMSSNVAQDIERKNLSPSLVTAMEGCGVRWLAGTFIVDKLVEEQPDSPATRGSIFHKVMEEFFSYPEEERTQQKIKEVVDEVLKDKNFSKSVTEESIKWLRTAINNYYSMGAKPQKVNVAEVPFGRDGEEVKGLELFVKGKIRDTKRDILGFIDQLVVDYHNSDFFIVQDWKTGKAKHWNPKTKSDEGFAEQRQQIIYTKLLQDKGLSISGARLIYPVAKHIENVDINDEDMKNRVFDSVQEADSKLSNMIDNNIFEYSPNFLCAWCPLAKMCPVADIKPYQKMQDALASQPDPESLLPGIEIG